MSKLSTLAAIILFSFSLSGTAHAGNFALKKGEQKSVKAGSKSVICGYIRNKGAWSVVKKVGNKFAVVAKPKANEKAACGKLLSSKLAKSMNNLPGLSSIIRTKRNSSAQLLANAVSGTPPAMVDISDIGVGNVFWNSGVMDTLRNTPDANSCSQFFISAVDGESAGYEGANTVEDIGYTFEPLLRSASNICYARSLPTTENLDSGVLSVVAGELPGSDVTQLFKEPAGSASRLIKINFTADSAVQRSSFIKIAPAEENKANAQHFAYSFWTCGTNSEGVSVKVYEEGKVKLDGTYVVHRVGDDNYGTFDATASGRLKVESGTLEFDPAVARSAEVKYLSISEMNRFKAALSVDASGALTENFLNRYRGRLSKKVILAKLSGESVHDAAVTELAFKDQLIEEDLSSRYFLGAIEYRDSNYKSAPDSELISKVSDESLADPFYDDVGEVEFDDSAYDCAAQADVEVSVNLDVAGARDIVESCSDESDQVNNFARENDSLMSLLDGYEGICGGF